MAWEARSGLKLFCYYCGAAVADWLNGLGSPFGIETIVYWGNADDVSEAKWPGKPVRD